MLFGEFLPLFRTSACSQTRAELHLVCNGGVFESLGVGVAHDEVYSFYAFPIHIGNGVTATTTHTNDFDVGC